MSRENSNYFPIAPDIKLAKIAAATSGDKKEPAIIVGEDAASGWYEREDGATVFASYGEDNIIQHWDYTEFRQAIFLAGYEPKTIEIENGGLLYRKPNEPGLWWQEGTTEFNLITKEVRDTLAIKKEKLGTFKLTEQEKEALLVELEGRLQIKKILNDVRDGAQLDDAHSDGKNTDDLRQADNNDIILMQIPTLEMGLEDAKKDLAEIKVSISDLESVKQGVVMLRSDVENLKVDISNTKTGMLNVRTNVSNLVSELKNLSEQAATKKEVVDLVARVDQLQNGIAEFSALNKKLFDIDNQMKESVKFLDDKIKTSKVVLDGKIENKIKAVNDSIEALTPRLLSPRNLREITEEDDQQGDLDMGELISPRRATTSPAGSPAVSPANVPKLSLSLANPVTGVQSARQASARDSARETPRSQADIILFNTFRTDIIELQRSVKDIQDKIREIDQLKAARVTLLEKIKTLEADLRANIDGLRSNVESLQQSDIRTSAAIEALKASDDNFKAGLVVLKSQLHAKLEELRIQIVSVETNYQEIMTRIDSLNASLGQMVSEFAESKVAWNNLLGLPQNIIELKAKDDELKVKDDELKVQVNQVQQQITDLAICQTADNTALVEVKQKVNTLENNLANALIQIQQKFDALPTNPSGDNSADIIALKTTDIELKAADAELKANVEELKITTNQNVSVLQQAVEELKTNVVELKTVDAELKANITELKTADVELKTNVEELKANVAELKAVDTELKTSVVELRTEVDQKVSVLQQSVSELKAADAELKTNVAELKTEVAQKANETSLMREENAANIAAIREELKTISANAINIEVVNSILANLEKINQDNQLETAAIQRLSDNVNLLPSVQQVAQQIADLKTELQSSIEQEKVSTEQKIGEINNRLENLQIGIPEEIKGMPEKLAAVENQVQEVKIELKDLSNAYNKFTALTTEDIDNIDKNVKNELIRIYRNITNVSRSALIQVGISVDELRRDVFSVLDFRFENLSNEIKQSIGNAGLSQEQVNQIVDAKAAELTLQIASIVPLAEEKIALVTADLRNELNAAIAELKTSTGVLQTEVEAIKANTQNGLPSSENQFRPDLTFQKDQTSGISVPAAGVVNIVTDSVTRVGVSASGLQLDVPILMKETKSYEPLQNGEAALLKKGNSLIWATKNEAGDLVEVSLDKQPPAETIALEGGVNMSVIEGPEQPESKILNVSDAAGTMFSVSRDKLELLGGIMEKKDGGLFFNGEALKGLNFPLRLSPDNRIWAGQLTLENVAGKGFVVKHDDNMILQINPDQFVTNLPISLENISNEQLANLMVSAAADPQKTFVYRKEQGLMLLQGSKEVNLLDRYNPVVEIDVVEQELGSFKEGSFVCYNESGHLKPIVPVSTKVIFEQKMVPDVSKTILSAADFGGNLHVVGYEVGQLNTPTNAESTTPPVLPTSPPVFQTTLTLATEIKGIETTVETVKRFALEGQHHDIKCLFQKTDYAIVLTRGHKCLNFICIYESGDQLSHKIDLEYDIDQYAAVFDSNNGMFLAVGFDIENKNFTAVTISKSVEEQKITHSVKYNLLEMGVSLQQKKLTLLTVPGGTYIISYGAYKLPFMVASLTDVVAGELYIDYQTNECPSMIYDTEKGQIVTFEKTITGSCYIQVLDILGTKLQKINTKMLSNDVVEPVQILEDGVIVYRNAANCDVIRFFKHNGHLDFSTTIIEPFDGENATEILPLPVSKDFALISKGQVKLLPKLSENPAEFIGVVVNKSLMSVSVMSRGHLLDVSEIDDLPLEFIGRKLYLTNAKKDFPLNLSTDENKGVFVGKCIARNKILLAAFCA